MNEAQVQLAAAIQRIDARWRLRINHNRGTLLSLRWRDNGGTVSVHADLLDNAEFCAALPAWVASGGRRADAVIDAVVGKQAEANFHARSREIRAQLPPYEALGGPCDLPGLFRQVHAAWFAHLTPLNIAWGRRVAAGRSLTHIRFGVYHPGRHPRILIHPRLDQPWVARIFVEHVLFHELCHHAQAGRPQRGEHHHSPRFRAWEQRYPHHAEAIAWEEAYLPYLLSGRIPD